MLIKNNVKLISVMNNQGGDSIRYEICQFNMKRKGKQAAYFKCISK